MAKWDEPYVKIRCLSIPSLIPLRESMYLDSRSVPLKVGIR